ncbi:hypothetical protein BDV06DRAFT_212449 [Aspergillus oleicola]
MSRVLRGMSVALSAAKAVEGWPCKPDTNNPLDESFNKKVNWALEHYHIPGLAISVVQNGSTFAKAHQGYGFANLSSTPLTPVTNSTLFFAGSTTKAHIAAAISLLVDDDEKYPGIQWDTPVQSILPEFQLSDPIVAAQVTIVDILSHRTGLPRHDMVLLQRLSRAEVVKRLKYLPLTRGIRAEFQYCNLMYITAGYLIESITGMDLETFMTENLWGVLGMNHTFFTLQTAQNKGLDIAEGYWVDPRSNETYSTENIYNPTLTGAGNILTSVSDYSLWISALLSHSPPLSEKGYEALFSAQTIGIRQSHNPFSSPMLYGLGWMIQAYKGKTIISHDGAQDGFGALVLLLPGRRLGVSILGNYAMGTNAAAQVLAFELVDRLLGSGKGREERFDWVGVIDAGLQLGKPTNATLDSLFPSLPDKPSLLPHPLNLSSYEGVYKHPSYPTINISSTCASRSKPTLNPLTPSKWTGAQLCGTFQNIMGIQTSELIFDFLHISGQYWTLVMELEGMQDATRVEFEIGPEGIVNRVGVEFEVTMREMNGKIWFERNE